MIVHVYNCLFVHEGERLFVYITVYLFMWVSDCSCNCLFVHEGE